MTNQHPITPPADLIARLHSHWFNTGEDLDVTLTQAFQAGADQELEACCKLLELSDGNARDFLQSARRPKPPSLKEQALNALSHLIDGAAHSMDTTESAEYIRRALEQLPND